MMNEDELCVQRENSSVVNKRGRVAGGLKNQKWDHNLTTRSYFIITQNIH